MYSCNFLQRRERDVLLVFTENHQRVSVLRLVRRQLQDAGGHVRRAETRTGGVTTARAPHNVDTSKDSRYDAHGLDQLVGGVAQVRELAQVEFGVGQEVGLDKPRAHDVEADAVARRGGGRLGEEHSVILPPTSQPALTRNASSPPWLG